MKKIIFLLFCTVLFFGCSSDDSSSDSNVYNPPSWIQGTWGYSADVDAGTNDIPVYRFTSNNVCQVFAINFCWKEAIEQDTTNNISGSDTSSDNTYSASLITGEGTLTTTISFERVSSTKILLIDNINGDTELDKLN